MMKTKDMLLGLAVLAVLVGIYFLTASDEQAPPVGNVFEKIISKEYSRDNVRSLQVFLGDDKDNGFTAERESGAAGWTLADRYGYPADGSRLDRIIKALFDLEGEVRSTSSKALSVYCLEDSRALHLVMTMSDGDRLEFLAGKKGPDWGQGFVRRAGENSVYFVNKNLLSELSIYDHILSAKLKPSDFLDHKLCQDDIGQAVKAELMHNPSSIAGEQGEVVRIMVEKPDGPSGKWQVGEPAEFPGDDTKITSWLGKLRYMKVEDGADPEREEDYGLGDTASVLVVTLERTEYQEVEKEPTGTTVEAGKGEKETETVEVKTHHSWKLLLGRGDGQNNYYVKVDGKREIYLLSKGSYDDLVIDVDTLKEEEEKKDDEDPDGTG